MTKNNRGRPRKTEGKRFNKPVYLSEDLYTKLVNAACADGFTDWRVWIDQMLVRRDDAYGNSVLITLNKEETKKNVG